MNDWNKAIVGVGLELRAEIFNWRTNSSSKFIKSFVSHWDAAQTQKKVSDVLLFERIIVDYCTVQITKGHGIKAT